MQTSLIILGVQNNHRCYLFLSRYAAQRTLIIINLFYSNVNGLDYDKAYWVSIARKQLPPSKYSNVIIVRGSIFNLHTSQIAWRICLRCMKIIGNDFCPLSINISCSSALRSYVSIFHYNSMQEYNKNHLKIECDLKLVKIILTISKMLLFFHNTSHNKQVAICAIKREQFAQHMKVFPKTLHIHKHL